MSRINSKVNMSSGRKASHRGLTLVEMMIAVFILAGAVAGIMGVILSARQGADRARNHYTAVNIAKNRTEEAYAFNFNTLQTFNETNITMDYDGTMDPNGDFSRTTTVTNQTTNLIVMIVNVGIRNRRTSQWTGEQEAITSLFANIPSH